MEFDYAEELLCDPNNIEIEIKRRQPEGSATRANQPNTSNELSSSFVNVPQGSPGVKAQFSSGNEITEQQNQRGMDSVSNDMDIGPVRSLSNEGQQCTPDSLSALRLEAPVYSEAELPYGAPIAEEYTGEIAPTVFKKVADRYPGEHPVAYKAELPFGAPVADDFTERSEASKPVSQMTVDDFAPMVDSIGKNGVPGGQKAADVGAGKAVTRKEYHHRIIEDIKSKFRLS